ncbi:hypothetical protein OEZ86_012494 [Tetradesmus obliquus]|nr:hypothetical protein OEZ86_012494 [Tetradesmus obliquus]
MPPELLKAGQVSPAVDVYSFGVMMWTLFTNQPPFKKLHYGQYYEAICLQGLRPLIPANTPVDYKLLMEKCWSTDRQPSSQSEDVEGPPSRASSVLSPGSSSAGWSHANSSHYGSHRNWVV